MRASGCIEELPLIIKTLAVGPIQTNCYLIGCPGTLEAAVIDPGWDAPKILSEAEAAGLTINYVLNTHAHWDHISANADIVQATGAKLAIHRLELPLLRARGGADLWGIPVQPSPDPDLQLEESQTLEVGDLTLQVLFTPGHTPGHVSFYEASAGAVFDGDVLFKQGIGRTDLPGGDYQALMHSIRDVLMPLPGETAVYSGHGPATTIAEERLANPWLSSLHATRD
jgi:glyoxylase-like metal-dependent hydrolase (beta-lactamase superfamily II)